MLGGEGRGHCQEARLPDTLLTRGRGADLTSCDGFNRRTLPACVLWLRRTQRWPRAVLEARLPPVTFRPSAMSSGDSTSRLEEALNALLQGDDASCTAAFAGKPPRGVTRHKRSGRWESHVWHQRKQLYVGGWASEHAAARAFDVVCLQSRGAAAAKVLNFPVVDYAQIIPLLAGIANPELVALLRRRSNGWSRGKSRFRGVTQHRSGRFEARISGGICGGGRSSKQCPRPHPVRSATASSDSAATQQTCIWACSAASWKLRERTTSPPSTWPAQQLSQTSPPRRMHRHVSRCWRATQVLHRQHASPSASLRSWVQNCLCRAPCAWCHAGRCARRPPAPHLQPLAK